MRDVGARFLCLFLLVIGSGPQDTAEAQHKRVILLSNGSSLEQMTKDLLVLRDKYLRADRAGRDALTPQLRDLAGRRAEQLTAALSEEPETVFRVAVPQDVYDTLPPDVQRLLERRLKLEGVLESLRSPGTAGASSFPYQLRDRQGRTFRLHPVGRPPPVVPGASVKVEGLHVGHALVFRAANLSVVPRSGTDAQLPAVAIESPRQGETLSGTVTVRVSASDNQRVTQVGVLKDGVLLASRESPPYEFAWDTRRDADGPHTLTARATDADLNIGAAAPITVTVDNTPPRVTLKTPEPRATVSAAVPLEAEAADGVGLEAVKFLVDGVALGAAVIPPYRLNWDTAAGPNGRHVLEAVAVDRAKNTTTSAGVEVMVLNANRAPVLEPLGPQAVKEAVGLTFTVNATDPDGSRDPLRFRMTNLPSWATFDPISRRFTGTPDFTEASHDRPARVYEGIRVEVCDTQPLCDAETFSITVQHVNRPPVLTPLGAQTVEEGQAWTVTPVLHDPDDDPLQCTAEPIPPWAVFDASRCALAGTPGFDAVTRGGGVKSYPALTLQACDPAQHCVSQEVPIRVLDVNRRPALERIGDKTVEEGKPLTFVTRARDPDGDTVNWLVVGAPKGSTFKTEQRAGGEGLFTWTPRADQGGAYPMTFTASDGELSDAETLTIQVRDTGLTISGTVKNDIYEPMPGVTVGFSRPGESTREVRTNAKGEYLATGLPPGTYTVRAKYSAGNVPTSRIVHFSPLSQRVELATTDQRGIDFTGYTED
ncbi:MAG: carboxypeptidase regulatory-like domain-containing protein [Candidatus Omnitrophica bacterium]|nr:carboxypeptidase regulatory-like domain-containing protein [Candidatus Omnitrophota bacterium]